ncbi:MAG: YggS family pyridoxal phosphate-dependent enzyme [Verrucomicrobia bacterium]|nr:YggS family pyridoxal phosphate-dependent enzyme [Verrucomicrobiota bacterium]
MISFEDFKANTDDVLARIAQACLVAGRSPDEVQLLAVTKTHPAEAAEYVARYGLKAVGENRVQEAIDKKALSPTSLRWELIGHLQSNKAKLAAEHFDRIQSIDSAKLLTFLDRAASERGRSLTVLLQINAGRDPAKFGAEIEDTPRLLEAALACKSLRVEGLMTIAPLSDDPAVAQRTFATLRELRDSYAAQFGVPLRELSMGMTGDLAAAIAAGSTQVRVGTALFGQRSLVGP